MIDDLRPCLAHRIPINLCAPCWPSLLAHLGHACWIAITEGRSQRGKPAEFWFPGKSLTKPSPQELRATWNLIQQATP